MPESLSLPATEPVLPTPVERRQSEAVLAASAEIAAHDRGEAVLAIRTYGRSHLVLAVGGRVDAATITRLRALFEDPSFRALSNTELVVDLSHVRSCEPGLVRMVHDLRDRRRSDGCRVELFDPTRALGPELEDASLSEAFPGYNAMRRGPMSQQP